jgi:hypothetical protein
MKPVEAEEADVVTETVPGAGSCHRSARSEAWKSR